MNYRVIWAILCLIGYGLLVSVFVVGNDYEGKHVMLTVNDSNEIDITGSDTVIFEAASEHVFVLSHESGELVGGVPAPPPIGWIKPEYHKIGPITIPSGHWTVVTGDMTVVSFDADSPLLVKRILKLRSVGLVLVLSLIPIGLIWASGFAGMNKINNSKLPRRIN